MIEDIRDKSHISHQDIAGLNFIRRQEKYIFRKYYKQGLRSQIMEVLDSRDVHRQNRGEVVDGMRCFPWAKPLKMLRIFRKKFESPEHAFEEIKAYKILEKYLPQDSFSASYEFVVDYIRKGKKDFILCGLQEYVEGRVLNPWDLEKSNYLQNLAAGMRDEGLNPLGLTIEQFIKKVCNQAAGMIEGLKKMIKASHYLPDLAGIGNLILTPAGMLKLVDINNINPVSFSSEIRLDDKGYPVCDKSVEAMSIMEQKLLGRSIDRTEVFYRVFLEKRRMARVGEIEKEFHRRHGLKSSTRPDG